MKKNKFYLKSLIVASLLTLILSIEVYGQYGTSRRVARRTSRRTAARWSGGGYGYAGGGYYGGGVITTLPGGCVVRAITGINYQYCGGQYYRPYYQGTE